MLFESQVLIVIRIKLCKVIHELQIIELAPRIMHLQLPIVSKLLLDDLFGVLDLQRYFAHFEKLVQNRSRCEIKASFLSIANGASDQVEVEKDYRDGVWQQFRKVLR